MDPRDRFLTFLGTTTSTPQHGRWPPIGHWLCFADGVDFGISTSNITGLTIDLYIQRVGLRGTKLQVLLLQLFRIILQDHCFFYPFCYIKKLPRRDAQVLAWDMVYQSDDADVLHVHQLLLDILYTMYAVQLLEKNFLLSDLNRVNGGKLS